MKPDDQTKTTPPLHATAPHIAEALARHHAIAGLHEFESAVEGLNDLEKQAVQTALDAVRPVFGPKPK